VFLGKTLNAVFHLGAKQSIPVVVAQPEERHANRTASILVWYEDTEHIVNIWFKRKRRIMIFYNEHILL